MVQEPPRRVGSAASQVLARQQRRRQRWRRRSFRRERCAECRDRVLEPRNRDHELRDRALVLLDDLLEVSDALLELRFAVGGRDALVRVAASDEEREPVELDVPGLHRLEPQLARIKLGTNESPTALLRHVFLARDATPAATFELLQDIPQRRRDALASPVCSSEYNNGRLRSTAQSKNQKYRRLFLDSVVRQRAAVFQLLAREDEALLLLRNSCLLKYPILEHFHAVCRISFDCDGFACQCLDEDLYTEPKGLVRGVRLAAAPIYHTK